MNLYKIMLVDDEENVRESIERKVNWKSIGFELVGSVSNGEEALELVEHIHVDVVMTDIKMPFMDGLTLSARLKENYANIKVVLCSGFDDFEFAREAVHLEVEEYLLKPISANDLEKVFCKIKKSLDEEFDARRNLESLHSYYQKSLPMLREHLLAGILEKRLSEEQAQTMLLSYEMDFFAPFYSVSVLKADTRNDDKDLQNGSMIMLSLLNLAKEYLEKKISSYVLMYLDYVVVIARLKKKTEIKEFVYHMDQICKVGVQMLRVSVISGVGRAYARLEEIAISYKEAVDAFSCRILVEDGVQAIFVNDVEPRPKGDTLLEIRGLASLIHVLRFGSKEELSRELLSFINEWKQDMNSVSQYQLAFMETLTEILKLVRSYQINITEVFGENLDPYIEIRKFNCVDEFEEWIKEKCSTIHKLIRKERADSMCIMMEKAKAYIEKNYAKSTLAVEDLSNYLNVSAPYFSTIFKKSVGMSFVSYLTQVRLSRAVELLEGTDEKSYIIAEKVGYTEPNYFSYVFKKKYGVSPSKYRANKELV